MEKLDLACARWWKTHDGALASRPLGATVRVLTNGRGDIIFV
jgi:hypothetical protein